MIHPFISSPLRVLISLLLLLPTANCRNTALPACTPEELVTFFVNPSPGKFQSLSTRLPLTDSAFAAAVRALRSQSVAGSMLGTWLTDSSGQSYRVGFSTPPAIAVDTVYPLIIYLHGGTGSQRNDKGDSAFTMLKDLADSMDLFLASPSANRDAPWWSPIGLSRILQTLRFMALQYPIDPDKVFLVGVSDGATGCYAAANTIPEPFAGFIAISGFGGMLPQLGMALAPDNLRLRPVYNVNAGQDRIYPVGMVKEFVANLQSQGVPVSAKWYDNELHGFDYRASEMGTLAVLIRTWSKPAGRTVSWTLIPGFPSRYDHVFAWRNTSADAGATGFWRNDTMILRTRELSSLTLNFKDIPIGRRINCLLQADSEKTQKLKVSPKPTSWPEQLQLLGQGCFPALEKATVVTIIP